MPTMLLDLVSIFGDYLCPPFVDVLLIRVALAGLNTLFLAGGRRLMGCTIVDPAKVASTNPVLNPLHVTKPGVSQPAPLSRPATAPSLRNKMDQNTGYYTHPESAHPRPNGNFGRAEHQPMVLSGHASSVGSAIDDGFSPMTANQDSRQLGRGHYADPVYGAPSAMRNTHAHGYQSATGSSPAGSPAPSGQMTLHAQPQPQVYPRGPMQQGTTQPSTPSDNMQKLAEFADLLANSSPMQFSAEQRQDLQDFAKISSRVAPLGDVMMALMNRSLIHQAALLSQRNHEELVHINVTLTELQRSQVKNWTLSLDHRDLVRTIAKRLIIEPNRTNYTKLQDSVMTELEDRQKSLHIEDIIKHDSKLKALKSWARTVSIQARNFLREYIEGGLGMLPNKPGYRGLINFAQYVLAQFAPTNTIVTVTRESEVVMKLAVLRRFALNNKDLAAVDEPDEEQPNETEDAADGGPLKRRRLSTPAVPIKPKGKVSVANSFFGRFEAFLRIKSAELGSSEITSKAWTSYISQLIDLDYKEFPDEANEASNPASTQSGSQAAARVQPTPTQAGGGLGSIAALM